MSVRNYLIAATVAALLIWGWWALENYTGIRIGSRGARAVGGREAIGMIVPVLATIVAFPAMLVWWWQEAAIARNGMMVPATILSLGATAHEMRDVVLEYEVEGRTYSKKRTVGLHRLQGLSVGSTLPVVVDKRNWERFIVPK